jgi:hypothetical protein
VNLFDLVHAIALLLSNSYSFLNIRPTLISIAFLLRLGFTFVVHDHAHDRTNNPKLKHFLKRIKTATFFILFNLYYLNILSNKH